MICSGRVYYDLEGHDRRADATSVAIARMEMIYPFPKTYIAELAAGYPNLEEIVWCQEEPENMGRWPSMRCRLPDALGTGHPDPLRRPPRAGEPLRGLPGRTPLRAGADRADGPDGLVPRDRGVE